MFGLIPWTKERGTRSRALAPRYESPFVTLRREIDSFFDDFFSRWPTPMTMRWGWDGWDVDLEDAGKEVIVRAEAPGFEPNEFDVQLRGDQLFIRAEHKEEAKEEEEHARRYGVYERWLTLPAGLDADKVEARYRNGVLEVHLPKTPEALGRKIEVKT
jgi:HSP20 family protein